ncbi:MAG: tetratricopeptide repeat protein [Fimbriimonadales bacterium]
MKRIILYFAGVVALGSLSACGKVGANSGAKPTSFTLTANSATDHKLNRLKSVAEANPKSAKAYNELGSALMQKGRETNELDWYDRARSAFEKASQIDPKDSASLRNLAWAWTMYHDFPEAIKYAKRAIAIDPGDHLAYGVLVDSNLELGRYPRAVEAAQKMVDLRPGLASYSRASQIRWIHGDVKGAIWMMQRALEAGGPYAENSAWARTQLGDMYFKSGNTRAAEQEYEAVRATMPEYRHALAGMARVRSTQAKFPEAIRLWQKAMRGRPNITYVIELGDLYTKLGEKESAERQYARVEELIAEHTAHGIGGDELIQAMYYLDRNISTDKALELARSEIEHHTTVQAYTTLAWAYHKNGKDQEATTAIAKALSMRTQDALLYYRAARIYAAAGDAGRAKKFANFAASLNPNFHTLLADDARRMALGK